MKNKIYIVVVGALIGLCGDVRSEYSYMDTIRITDDFTQQLGAQKDLLQLLMGRKTVLLYLGKTQKNMIATC